MPTFEEQLRRLESLEPLIDAVGDDNVSAMGSFLYDRISHPDSYLVFLGETSSGKSSIINGLLGEQLLPVKANPSTAAITEIMIAEENGPDEFYALNSNATMEVLDKQTFTALSEQPDKNLSRLRLKKWIGRHDLGNLRIFDTPGYGSLIKEHDEVLKDFIPNSDVVVYTVSYRVGIQEDDYLFLRYIGELLREDVKVLLVVNRCPVGDRLDQKKIDSIQEVVSGLLPLLPTVITISDVKSTDGGRALVTSPELWDAVSKAINSPERTDLLHKAFDEYIEGLYHTCDDILTARYAKVQLDEEVQNKYIEAQRNTAERIRRAVPELIEPTFDRLSQDLPRQIDIVADNTSAKVCRFIDNESKFSKDEAVAYVNSHLLPHTVKCETGEMQTKLATELNDLNDKVDDYIQQEMIDFNKHVNDIVVRLDTNQGQAVEELLKTGAKEFMKQGLKSYFVSFGGAGGANAGVANAASHMLKKVGDFFGHTFKRTTHNGLKSFLGKIGATSMKVVGVAVAVFIQVLFDVYDLATWKGKLRSSAGRAIAKWEEDILPEVEEDLNKLKEENVKTVYQIADEILAEAKPVAPTGNEKQDYELSRKIGKELFNI